MVSSAAYRGGDKPRLALAGVYPWSRYEYLGTSYIYYIHYWLLYILFRAVEINKLIISLKKKFLFFHVYCYFSQRRGFHPKENKFSQKSMFSVKNQRCYSILYCYYTITVNTFQQLNTHSLKTLIHSK